MKIGVISEVYGGITTPPRGYGGIAASVSHITEEFVRRGHDVRLFAIHGSHTSGTLVEVEPGDGALSTHPDAMPPYVREAKKYLRVIDVWIDGSHHKRFARMCLEQFPEINVICPSWNPNLEDLPQNPIFQSPHMYAAITGEDKPNNIPWFWWGIPLEKYMPCYNDATESAVSINVLSSYKGTDLLLAAAEKWGFDIRLFGNIDTSTYDKIKRLMELPNVLYLGEIGIARFQILQKSAMSMTLSTWPEPGSLVTLESLALGCPCVVTNAGCLPYYIKDGVNGAVVGRDPDSIFAGMQRVIDGGREMRRCARETAEEMFSLQKCVNNLERVLERVMDGERWAI